MDKTMVYTIPKIKICGIQTQEDVAIINELLPEYAGFVLAPSKRQVTLRTLEMLISALDKRIIPVGVFVNQELDYLMRATTAGIQVLQIHGDEPPSYIRMLKTLLEERKPALVNIAIWKVLRLGQEDKAIMPDDEILTMIDGIVYDKYDPKAYGGTGETFDWENITQNDLNHHHYMILAGGLTTENVRSAITLLDPYCVDVSSSVETNGRKDKVKLQEFIEAVRRLDYHASNSNL